VLELLAGPITIYNGASPGSPIDAIGVSNGIAAFYDDSLGLCTYNLALGGYCIVQLDGAAYLRSYQPRGNAFALDLQRSDQYIIHASLFEDALYLFDKAAGTQGELVINTGIVGDMTNIAVRTADRYLDGINSVVRFRPLDLSAPAVTEATLTGAGTGVPIFSRTRNNDVLALIWPTGQIAYYDVNAQAQVDGSGNIGANVGAWYSRKHDIFIALATAGTIKVFANTVRPSTLSNPVAVTSLTQGRVSQIKVRLLGSNSDPCVDELVDWSITAGVGALADAQSTTDADGWAYNDYIAPVTSLGSPSGSVTIQAQVLY
jgi:hypothetical protein